MPLTPVPPYTPLPDPPDSADPDNFDTRADAFLGQFPQLQEEMDATAESAYQNALYSKEQAVLTAADRVQTGLDKTATAADRVQTGLDKTATAADRVQTGLDKTATAADRVQTGLDVVAADGFKDDAAGFATDSANSATASESARDLAETYRDQAQIFATQQLTATSTTSITPGTLGDQTLNIQPGKAFVTGMYLVVTSTGTPTAKFAGYVKSYDIATGVLVITIDAFGGTGAHTDWAIGVAVAGNIAGLTTQLVTTGTINVLPDVLYIIGASGIVLDMSATAWVKGKKFEISESIGTGSYTVNFGTVKDRRRTRGLVVINANFLKYSRIYEDTTEGLI